MAIQRAIKYNPNFAEAYYNKGVALGLLSKYEEAIKAYDLALKYKPDYIEAYYNKGSALYLLHKYKESVEQFDLALKLKPDYAKGYYAKFLVLEDLGKLEESKQAYDLAMKYNPDLVDSLESGRKKAMGSENVIKNAKYFGIFFIIVLCSARARKNPIKTFLGTVFIVNYKEELRTKKKAIALCMSSI